MCASAACAPGAVTGSACAPALGTLRAHRLDRRRHARSRAPRTQIAGCPVFPADNAWNRDVSNDPVDPRLRRATSRRCRATCIPTSARAATATTASRSRSCRASAAGADPVHRLRRRERSRPVPGAARRARRGRQRPRTCSSCSRGRASSTSSSAPSAPGRAGTRTPARCSTCARTRSARPAGRRPTRPGCRSSRALARSGPDPPRAALHRAAHAARLRRTRRATSRRTHTNPTSRRWGCASGCAPTTTSRLPRAGADDPQGAADLRDDRRRQRVQLVHLRRAGPALGRRRPRPAQAGPGQRLRGRPPGAVAHAARPGASTTWRSTRRCQRAPSSPPSIAAEQAHDEAGGERDRAGGRQRCPGRSGSAAGSAGRARCTSSRRATASSAIAPATRMPQSQTPRPWRVPSKRAMRPAT